MIKGPEENNIVLWQRYLRVFNGSKTEGTPVRMKFSCNFMEKNPGIATVIRINKTKQLEVTILEMRKDQHEGPNFLLQYIHKEVSVKEKISLTRSSIQIIITKCYRYYKI